MALGEEGFTILFSSSVFICELLCPDVPYNIIYYIVRAKRGGDCAGERLGRREEASLPAVYIKTGGGGP